MPKSPAVESTPKLAVEPTRATVRRVAAATIVGCAAAAFMLYWLTLAPGLTWSHFGADGGELLAAATTNGVPHPPGYPLYMLLLQGWLAAAARLFPASDLAWRGNLLSALLAAVSVGLSVPLMARLLKRLIVGDPQATTAESGAVLWLWASLGSLAWGASQQLWSQALITEVYALHALIIVLLLWLLFAPTPAAGGQPAPLRRVWVAGAAHWPGAGPPRHAGAAAARRALLRACPVRLARAAPPAGRGGAGGAGRAAAAWAHAAGRQPLGADALARQLGLPQYGRRAVVAAQRLGLPRLSL